MGENTKIEWRDHTFSPWRERSASAKGMRVVAAEAAWKQVAKWDREAAASGESRSVFCGSLCDVFEYWTLEVRDSRGSVVNARTWKPIESEGPEPATIADIRQRIFRLIDATPNLTWLLLTKRPQNIRLMWPTVDKDFADLSTLLANHMRAVHARIAAGGAQNDSASEHVAYASERDNMPCRDNVWLGTSIACQEDAERNIPELLKCRDLCAGLFLSIEPLLDDIDIRKWLTWELDVDKSRPPGSFIRRITGINQVIVGGESGPNARPCDVAWIRSIVRQCAAAGVRLIYK